LRSWEVPPGLGGEPEEEHGLVREDWGCNGAKMRFRRREWKEGEWR